MNQQKSVQEHHSYHLSCDSVNLFLGSGLVCLVRKALLASVSFSPFHSLSVKCHTSGEEEVSSIQLLVYKAPLFLLYMYIYF